MSGHLSPNDFLRLMLKGARDFVSKPWNSGDLVARLHDAGAVGRDKYLHTMQSDTPCRRCGETRF